MNLVSCGAGFALDVIFGENIRLHANQKIAPPPRRGILIFQI